MSTYESYETYEGGPFETESEYEYEYETQNGEYETADGPIGELVDEAGGEAFPGGLLGESEAESPLGDAQEMALAHELLDVQSEEELEEFLGKLIKRATKAVGGFVRSPVGKALGGVLKNVAKTALPVVGGALGSMVAPGVGTALGSKLGTMASRLFELELDELESEEAELEVARNYVRFAATAAQRAAKAPRSTPPPKVVKAAVTKAATAHAPGLLRAPVARTVVQVARGATPPVATTGYGDSGSEGQGSRQRSGRWVRRGRRIVVIGA